MADVDPIADVYRIGDDDGQRSRAQMMLVGAVVLAVVLVALALVLNSVIFTENLATRDQGSDIQDATQFRSETRGSVAGSIIHVNDFHRGGDFSNLYNTEYDPVLRNFSEMNADARAIGGTSATVEDEYGHPGTQIVDDNESATQPFLPKSLIPVNWTVAQNVTFRRFTMNAKKNLLSNVSESTAKNSLKSGESTIFFIEFEDSKNRIWHLGIWRTVSNTAQVNIVSLNETSGDFSEVCRSTAPTVELDFSHQTFEGTHCDAFEFTEDIDGKTTIRFWNGLLASGTFRLTVDRAEDSLRDVVNSANYGNQCFFQTYHNSSSDGSPYTQPAIYSTIVDASYRSSSAEYDGDVYVEPKPIGTQSVAPTVTKFDVNDQSTLSEHKFTVSWETADSKDDPVSVVYTLVDGNGTAVNQTTGNAADTKTLKDPSLTLTTHYILELNASDTSGNTRIVRQLHDSDGNQDGCPP